MRLLNVKVNSSVFQTIYLSGGERHLVHQQTSQLIKMQCPKRPSEDQDPDYPELQPSDSKRQKLAIDRGDNFLHFYILTLNNLPNFVARDETCLKIKKIINSQFEFEMKKREEELFECQDRLNKARQNLRLLRYAVVSSYYRAQVT